MNTPVAIKLPHVLEIVETGEGHRVILPPDLLAKLGVGAGDRLDVVDGPDGLILRPHDAGFAEQMEAAERIMREDRDILAVLAK